ncbi:uncharacterized protein LOC124353966 isoform X1 [Homalodisca vitripennis]|uniref:uncharacterized protein LOC124353966 isoform X1 n=1 Tax=Homalodisca vitripennis TaxID=197043 RepID=UPI001EEBB36D|nr:uncharacterized protein LOC124353966 isoform X1 [Homalodisca vitripennis]XP_046660011.1 uncharacterized protein LOC124353966 isoform X1 [Homalodisca vitripennis]XP_046660012.1 uncharacterized protein LOC124353966 isoform X1 [Homalodisca vitripennis]XP_046660013.1 uncharacterized protein LOC124353966 isoform X1 [Homalodisca vitripennis]XP_046660014.1 uncharacterized protein LOC124353966 isoform X1 [Homalodisca vitripennis]
MLTLPEEVLEIIVAHLTAKELAACCGVSLGWRELFNKDIFWKRFCDKRLPEYLRTISSRVTPRFVIPQNSNSDLTPLCDWRLSYMREAHLWANLLEGRHTIEYLDSEVNSVIIQCKFLKNDFLLTLGSKIVVYDIRATPVIYVENPIRLLPMHSVDLCEVFGDRIVIVQYFVVQVYHINLVLQNWPQERIFVYNQDTECTFEENQDINSHILGLPLCARKPVCKIIGNIFLGSDQINGSIHIWDLKTGKKIKEEVFKLALSSRFIEFKPSTTCKTEIVVVLKQNMADGECFLFLVYNLQSFEFYPLAKSYSRYSQCLLFGEHLAIVSFNNLQILNYKTCEMIRELFSESVTIDVWKNNIVFNEGKNLRRFLSSAEEVTLLELDMKIVHFKLFNDKFLRVSVKGDGKQDWQGQMCGWNIEIERTYWNIGNDWKKIIQFPFRVNDLCVNEPCTKIVASVIGLPWVLINYW